MIMKIFSPIKNEQGTVLVIAILILLLITVLGLALLGTTTAYVKIVGNEKIHKISFYAAEASRSYVAASPALYGTDNITVGGSLAFPNDADPSQKFALDSKQFFNGSVEYLGSTVPPRGSGYAAGKYRAHRYMMACSGFGPVNTQTQVEAGFYRIGF